MLCLGLYTILHGNTAEPQLTMKSMMRLETNEQSTTGKMQFGWPSYGQVTWPTTIYSTPLLILRVRIVAVPSYNGALAGWMPDFTSSPNGHFWTTWSFIGRALYISAGGHHTDRAYSVLRTAPTAATAAVHNYYPSCLIYMYKSNELVGQLDTKMNLKVGICKKVLCVFLHLTESKTYGCFCQLMKRMTANFPHGGTTMDDHFDRMRLLIQVLSSALSWSTAT